MAETWFVELATRGLLALTGEDRQAFLQGLVTNDIDKVAAGRAIYAALLTPQGKYLHDFFIAAAGDTLWLEGEAARLPDLERRLAAYRLRARVTIARPAGDFAIFAACGATAAAALGLAAEPGRAAPMAGGFAFVDPRLADLGVRLVAPRPGALARLAEAGFGAAEFAAYDRMRIEYGVPDGSRDLTVDKTVLLEAGFDELNGIAWQKGCYVGQELTARTRYRGLVKRRLMPVRIDGVPPEPGTKVTRDGEDVGEMRSAVADRGLAVLRIDAASRPGAALQAGAARLVPIKPDWMNLPETAPEASET